MNTRCNNRFIFATLSLACTLLFSPLTATAIADTSDDVFTLAISHYQRGQWKQSISYFEQFAEEFSDDPRSQSAKFYLGEARMQTGEYLEARKHFLSFVGMDPKHPAMKRALFRLGESSYLTNDSKQAYRYLSQFLTKHKNDALLEYVLPYLGQLETDRNNTTAGVQRFEEALKHFPNGVMADECRLGLGVAIAQTDPAQAKRFLSHVSEHGKAKLADDATLEIGKIHFASAEYTQAIEQLKQFEQKFADSDLRTIGTYWHGRCLAQLKKYSESQVLFEQVMKTQLSADFGPPVYFESAVVAQQMGDYDLSSDRLHHLLDNWPQSEWSDESLLLLSQNAYQAKHFYVALQHADHFLKRFPNNELKQKILELKGKSLLSLEQNQEGIKVFKSLLSDDDILSTDQVQRAKWHYLYGLGLFRDEQNTGALAAFDEVLKLTKNPLLKSASHLARSTIQINKQNYQAAITSLEGYLTVSADSKNKGPVLAELARAYTQVGDYNNAGKRLVHLLEQSNDGELVTRTLTILAENAYAAKQYEKSAMWFELLTLDKDNAAVYARGLSGLAWSLSQNKQATQAMETFQKLVDHCPESKLADESLFKLGLLQSDSKMIDAAIATFCKFEKSYRASDHWPDSVLHIVKLTEQRGAKNDPELAAGQLQTLIENREQLKQDDEFLYHLAWLRKELGQKKQSEQIFQKISHTHKKSKYWADASYRVAEIAVRENRLDDAKKLLNELVDMELDADDALAHAMHLKGKIAIDQADWPAVEANMKKLMATFPDHALQPVAEYWRAESAYRLQDFAIAQKRFTVLLDKIKPTQSEIMPGALLRLAQIHGKKEEWSAANRLADQFLNQFPEHHAKYEAEFITARALSAKGKFVSARDKYQSVLSDNASRGTETAALAQFMIAESFFHQEDYKSAIKGYHKVEILHPFPQWKSAAMLQCGKCYELEGDSAEAIANYEQLLKKLPDSAYAGEAKQRSDALKSSINQQ